jgi:hypothetical protein
MNSSPEPALLPERAGCPQCGSTSGKRWRSYSGIELCTDCEWDYLSDLNGRKLLDARAALPPAQPQLRRTMPRKKQHPVRAARPRTDYKSMLDKLVQPGYNSICLLCARIYYGAAMSSCSRCGGLCVQRSDHDLGLMGRRATQVVEAGE